METLFAQNAQLALLMGPKQCGKTTLAFKIVYDAAVSGQSPLFVCRSIHAPTVCMISDQNFPNQRCLYEPEVLDRIRIKFAGSVGELTILMSSLHLFNPLPSLIVIDDLVEMTSKVEPGLESLLFSSAMIQNAALFLSEKNGDTKPIAKFLTVLSCPHPHIISALKRYYHVLCHIERTSSGRTVVKVNTVKLPPSTTLRAAISTESAERSFSFTVSES